MKLTKEKLELVEMLNNPKEKCITLWYKIENNNMIYNHFEYGVETFINFNIVYPKAINENFKSQKKWKNQKWIKTTAMIEVKTGKIKNEFYYDENKNFIKKENKC